MDIEIVPCGWCVNHIRCKGVGVECVRVGGVELCRECEKREAAQ